MLVVLQSQTPPSGGLSLTTTFTARAPASLSLSVTFAARQSEPLTLSTLFTARRGAPAAAAGDLLSHDVTLTLSNLTAHVLNWSYSHSGTYEELSVTVAGQHGLATPGASLTAFSLGVAGATAGIERSFQSLGQEPQVDVGEDQTVFLFRNDFDTKLRGIRLPELISWKLLPSDDPCLTIRRYVSISGLVMQVMRANVSPTFALEDDPLAGLFWEEGRRDFSTDGLTPQGLWDATYGALGMVLHVRAFGTGISLVGVWPEPISAVTGTGPPADLMLSRQEGRENRHTPARLTVRSADGYKKLTNTLLLSYLGADPARAEVERELATDLEWADAVESSGTTRVYRGYRREAGQLTASAELTTSDIEVKESGDTPFQKIWQGVATGYKSTTTTYDPDCRTRPVQETTVTKAWGFDAHTIGSTFTPGGPGALPSATAGDLTADETTVTTYSYSPQGWLAAKTTHARRLASLQQTGADGDAADRQPLTGREYVTTIWTERWQPTGGGRWIYWPGIHGQQLVAVYDAASGEAIRTATVTRALPDPPRVTDQAPPSSSCDDCEGERYVHAPGGIEYATGDAGFGEERELSLGFIEPKDLPSIAPKLLSLNWHRQVTSFTVPVVFGALPGSTLADGRVRELRVSMTAPGEVESSVTVVKPDYLYGNPSSLPANLTKTPHNAGTAIMLAGRPDGMRALVLRGWNTQSDDPITEDSFIRLRSGFPPRPGDEVEWVLVNGVKEARSARR